MINPTQVDLISRIQSCHYGDTKEFPPLLKPMNKGEAYALKVFNLNETGLPLGCLPCSTFIVIVQKTLCGFKAAKDHFMVLLGSNASKRPLMVYNAENSWSLRAYIKT
jgi:hypothetical protein